MAAVLHSAPKIAMIEGIADTLAAALGDMLIHHKVEHGEFVFSVQRERVEDALRLLRDEHEYQQLMEIAGADYPIREERFEVVYMLLSVTRNHRVLVKCRAAENTPVPTVTTLWPNAGWLEREVYDMFGVLFEGNTDLRRILTDYGFEGHPFRKDFPLTGYQELRYSEEEKRVVYEPVDLAQDFRTFDFMSPWEGADYILPGDEKAEVPPPAPVPQAVQEPKGKVDTKEPVTRGDPKVNVPQTTDKPSETGAGAKTDAKAADRVAPASTGNTVAGQGDGEPVPVKTDVAEPGAPEETDSRPDEAAPKPRSRRKKGSTTPGKDGDE